MPQYRIAQVAELLGVSDDTVRRWVEAGRLQGRIDGGVQVIEGEEVASFARRLVTDDRDRRHGSARNRLTGIVTEVVRDGVMAQVEIAAGRYRIVSLLSREAADELQLAPGVLATAVIKATMVTVEADAGSGP
ncbi:MAG: TOBE domain-containing protein [Actinobacteria bacterium]|nr:TOBE domain-containing protein [Actinomycetota bacterium]MCB9411736.1 TOBE domain-containing protein [Actinomycetota bacterium]